MYSDALVGRVYEIYNNNYKYYENKYGKEAADNYREFKGGVKNAVDNLFKQFDKIDKIMSEKVGDNYNKNDEWNYVLLDLSNQETITLNSRGDVVNKVKTDKENNKYYSFGMNKQKEESLRAFLDNDMHFKQVLKYSPGDDVTMKLDGIVFNKKESEGLLHPLLKKSLLHNLKMSAGLSLDYNDYAKKGIISSLLKSFDKKSSNTDDKAISFSELYNRVDKAQQRKIDDYTNSRVRSDYIGNKAASQYYSYFAGDDEWKEKKIKYINMSLEKMKNSKYPGEVESYRNIIQEEKHILDSGVYFDSHYATNKEVSQRIYDLFDKADLTDMDSRDKLLDKYIDLIRPTVEWQATGANNVGPQSSKWLRDTLADQRREANELINDLLNAFNYTEVDMKA